MAKKNVNRQHTTSDEDQWKQVIRLKLQLFRLANDINELKKWNNRAVIYLFNNNDVIDVFSVSRTINE